MKYNLTDWYRGYQTPKRKGVYERDYETEIGKPSDGTHYCYWDGKVWHVPYAAPGAAALHGAHAWLVSDYQSLPWRGVRES